MVRDPCGGQMILSLRGIGAMSTVLTHSVSYWTPTVYQVNTTSVLHQTSMRQVLHVPGRVFWVINDKKLNLKCLNHKCIFPWHMCFGRSMDTLASGAAWSSVQLMSLGKISQLSSEGGLPSQSLSPLMCESHSQDLIFQGWHLVKTSENLWTSSLPHPVAPFWILLDCVLSPDQ